MLTRLARDAAGYVTSTIVGHRYRCPTVNALDAHLRYLRIVCREAVDPERIAICRLDIDRLLDRRMDIVRSATAGSRGPL